MAIIHNIVPIKNKDVDTILKIVGTKTGTQVHKIVDTKQDNYTEVVKFRHKKRYKRRSKIYG